MPTEIASIEEFNKIVERASECRVKIGYRRIESEEGAKRVKVLKVKARTPRMLYTIVFNDIDKGIEYVKTIKEKCGNLRVLDAELEGRL